MGSGGPLVGLPRALPLRTSAKPRRAASTSANRSSPMMWFAMDYSAVGAGADLVKLLRRENARTLLDVLDAALLHLL